MNYLEKVVMVTGAASGLGSSLVKGFLEKGSKVLLTDINVNKGKELLSTLQKKYGAQNAAFAKCDVTKDEDFEGAFKECENRLGAPNVLINSAMYLDSNWMKMLEFNLNHIVRGTEIAMKKMGKHCGGKGGQVVNVGSITGLAPVPLISVYAASKAAVVHYTRCIGHDFHHSYSGVTVQCVCQTLISTEVMDQMKALKYNSFTDETLQKGVDAFSPIHPDQVTAATLHMLEENKNGSVVVVDNDREPYTIDPVLVKTFY